MATLDTNFEDLLPDLEGLPESELRGMVERAAQIMDMTRHPGWSLLKDYVTHLSTTHQKRILQGRLETMEEYRYYVGLVDGLQIAAKAPDNLAARVARIQRVMEADAADSDRS